MATSRASTQRSANFWLGAARGGAWAHLVGAPFVALAAAIKGHWPLMLLAVLGWMAAVYILVDLRRARS